MNELYYTAPLPQKKSKSQKSWKVVVLSHLRIDDLCIRVWVWVVDYLVVYVLFEILVTIQGIRRIVPAQHELVHRHPHPIAILHPPEHGSNAAATVCEHANGFIPGDIKTSVIRVAGQAVVQAGRNSLALLHRQRAGLIFAEAKSFTIHARNL